MPKNLYLVRHGQSEGNLIRKEYEKTGNEAVYTEDFLRLHESQYALTELGIEQAKKAGQWFLENGIQHFDRMLVSNNVRAQETAAYLNFPNAHWSEDLNLRERDAGLFNTIKPSERDANYVDQQRFYDSQPFLFWPPQGESVAYLCIRIKVILDTLFRECDGQDVVIVCHGHVMRAIMIVLEKLSLEESNELLVTQDEELRLPNCSIIHYTRQNPANPEQGMSVHFDWRRIIRPAGGGGKDESFKVIKRKKFSNEDLLMMARKSRGL